MALESYKRRCTVQQQFLQAIKAANKLTNARAIVGNNIAIQHWTTAMLDMQRIKNEQQRVGDGLRQPSVTEKHRRAMNIISTAYDLIQATPREGNRHHITLMGNDIKDSAMASDDPMMAPDEHDLAFFNLSESIILWNQNMRTGHTAQDHTQGDIDVVQLTARPSAINIKTELPAFVTFTNEAVSLITAADTLGDVSLIDESLTKPNWHRSPVSPITVKGVAGSTEQLRHTVTVPVCLRWGAPITRVECFPVNTAHNYAQRH